MKIITQNPYILKIQEKIKEHDKFMNSFDIVNKSHRQRKKQLEQEIEDLQINSRQFINKILFSLKKEIRQIVYKRKTLKDVTSIKEQYREAINLYREAEKMIFDTRALKKQLRDEMKKCQKKLK